MFYKAGQVGRGKVDGNRNESDDGTNLPGIHSICDQGFQLRLAICPEVGPIKHKYT